VPTAMPMAATSQIEAAVVNSRMFPLLCNTAPAPKKPTPAQSSTPGSVDHSRFVTARTEPLIQRSCNRNTLIKDQLGALVCGPPSIARRTGFIKRLGFRYRPRRCKMTHGDRGSRQVIDKRHEIGYTVYRAVPDVGSDAAKKLQEEEVL
jgi:hypothetical protein